MAHKTGNISTVHHDAGIVYLEGRKPYVLVILTQFPTSPPRGARRWPRCRGTSSSALAGMTGGVMREGAGPQDRRRLRPGPGGPLAAHAAGDGGGQGRAPAPAAPLLLRDPHATRRRATSGSAPHFGLNEFLLVDLKEAERLRSYPRYVPCAVRVLAFYLERLREAVGAPIHLAVNGGYRSPVAQAGGGGHAPHVGHRRRPLPHRVARPEREGHHREVQPHRRGHQRRPLGHALRPRDRARPTTTSTSTWGTSRWSRAR